MRYIPFYFKSSLPSKPNLEQLESLDNRFSLTSRCRLAKKGSLTINFFPKADANEPGPVLSSCFNSSSLLETSSSPLPPLLPSCNHPPPGPMRSDLFFMEPHSDNIHVCSMTHGEVRRQVNANRYAHAHTYSHVCTINHITPQRTQDRSNWESV